MNVLVLSCLPFFLGALGTSQTKGPTTYVMKDRSHLRAKVLGVDGDTVRLNVYFEGGGHAETTKKFEDFEKHSAFRILRSVTPPDDVEARVELAGIAVKHGLLAAGQRELKKARKLADNQGLALKTERDLVNRAVGIIEDMLRQMTDQGKISDARRVVRRVLHNNPDLLTEQQKSRLIDLVEAKEAELKAKRAAQRKAAEDAAVVRERERRLEPLSKRLDRGKDRRKKALMESKNTSRAIRGFGSAIHDFEYVQRGAPRLAKKHSNDQILVEEATSMGNDAEQWTMRTMLDQASLRMVRGQFNDAIGNVNRVLAMDPDNKAALHMRARIEIAANEGWGVGGRVGRR